MAENTVNDSNTSKQCGCCCCCPKFKEALSSSSKSESTPNEGFVRVSDCKLYRTSLRREMGHLRVNDIALVELVEELQQRVKQLQDRVIELQGYVTRSTYDRLHLVDPSEIKGPPTYITQRFTPYEYYRRYLVGDYRNQPITRGFQTDEDIINRVDPKPDQIYTPTNYLPSPEEDDRPRERIYVKEMFIALGLEDGGDAADLSEIYEMLNDPSTKDMALDILKKYYTQGVMDTNDMTSDTEI